MTHEPQLTVWIEFEDPYKTDTRGEEEAIEATGDRLAAAYQDFMRTKVKDCEEFRIWWSTKKDAYMYSWGLQHGHYEMEMTTPGVRINATY